MWLAKPVYESLPFYYMAVGVIALVAGLYVNYWYWPVICVTVGLASLLAGLVVWLKRRDYRASRSRLDFDQANRL
jgi:ribose/xylose/arabinose/galactoside ABC-type transport system permease subunit